MVWRSASVSYDQISRFWMQWWILRNCCFRPSSAVCSYNQWDEYWNAEQSSWIPHVWEFTWVLCAPGPGGELKGLLWQPLHVREVDARPPEQYYSAASAVPVREHAQWGLGAPPWEGQPAGGGSACGLLEEGGGASLPDGHQAGEEEVLTQQGAATTQASHRGAHLAVLLSNSRSIW